MHLEQLLIVGILFATVGLFLWGRWRHDMVAVGALLACVFAGLVPYGDAFAGFAHPAVVTVACVLVLSHGLQTTGAVDALARHMLPAKAGPTLAILSLTALAALLSAFMNNVGALALLIPVGIQIATRLNLPPGKVLMPLAFGSILGGTTTMIGTPPNLIVSGLRDEAGLGSFGMFDFTPVGLALTLLGIVFIGLVGWRLVPVRKQASAEGFDTGAYLTEARVTEDSKAAGMKLREIEAALEEADAQIVSLVRNEVRVSAPNPGRIVHAGDILVIEAEAETLANALSSLGLVLEETLHKAEKKESGSVADAAEAAEVEKPVPSDEIVLVELAILPSSGLVGRAQRHPIAQSFRPQPACRIESGPTHPGQAADLSIQGGRRADDAGRTGSHCRICHGRQLRAAGRTRAAHPRQAQGHRSRRHHGDGCSRCCLWPAAHRHCLHCRRPRLDGLAHRPAAFGVRCH